MRFERDVVYGRAGGEALKMDLARPATGTGPFPLVVFVHGGAWVSGSKAQYHDAVRDLARRGYVAATIDHRLAPKHRFPAQIEDVKYAVRTLRARARELRIDPRRVGAAGDSAGGHLVLLLGLMDAAAPSGKVQAVVNYYGPTDFRAWHVSPLVEPFIVKAFGRGSRGVIGGFPRLEHRMGRIHRYGQEHDCLILNFVSTNTREGSVLQKLLVRLKGIRNESGTDQGLDVVGEVFPANLLERMLRDMYTDQSAIEARIVHDIDAGRFRAITESTLEGLAKRELNLSALVGKLAMRHTMRYNGAGGSWT